MGQTLSEPVTSKQTLTDSNEKYIVGHSSMQGWRVSMEDAHTVLMSISTDPDSALFAVFDGHGGASIAEFASQHLWRYITTNEWYQRGEIEEALRRGYLDLDAAMRVEETLRGELAGSTAITVLLKNQEIYCANAGDSRAIGVIGGRVQPLSFDHKPANEVEHRRIYEAGGYVEVNRVNGNLALSRALGDYNFKSNSRKRPEQQIVTANPDVSRHKMTAEWEFIVIACDGIWDVLSNEEVARFVSERLQRQVPPQTICEQLMEKCLAPDALMGGIGLDNMTVIIIVFRKDSSKPGDGGDEAAGDKTTVPDTTDEERQGPDSTDDAPKEHTGADSIDDVSAGSVPDMK